MKVSIIHNLYKKNRFVNETVRLNLLALNNDGIDYQYLLFNDNGDPTILDDVKEFINDKVEYIYSKKNWGERQFSGGWIGALPFVKGELIHNTSQDDVMGTTFYKRSIDIFKNNPDIDLVTYNGFKVKENLELEALLIHPQYRMDGNNPLEVFKNWFGVENNIVTRCNNGFLAAGTIYRKSLHDKIGIPDAQFAGACDFEMWARILFNEHKFVYISEPNWLYRMSEYSAGNEIINGLPNRGHWQQLCIEKIKEKYTKLWNEKYGK